jgi:hypothetical protein
VRPEYVEERKCGTCQNFAVRPPEVGLARVAKPMSACGPGQYCYGGPVRGRCTYWNRMAESTQVCDKYMPGGPSVIGAGSLAKRGKENWTEKTKNILNNGSFLTLGTVALLAAAHVIARDVKYFKHEISGLPHVTDDEGLIYYYKLAPGRDKVVIYKPTGLKRIHNLSPRAGLDKKQLQDEVKALVLDFYDVE